MGNRITKSVLLFLLVFTGLSVSAQSQVPKDSMVWNGTRYIPMSTVPVDTIQFDLSEDIGKQLQPLDTVLEYAVRYSPGLKFEDASFEKAQYNTKYTRYLWLNGVTGFFNYTYGNQSNYNTMNADGTVLNNSLGIGYRIGANVTLPLTEVFGRPKRIKQMKAEEKMAMYKRADAELDLKREVIAAYFNMISAQRMMSARQQDVESARLSVEIATVEMKRGKIHPSELSRLKNVLTIAETNLEMSRRDFMIFYYQLEVVVGVKLSTLKKK